MDKLIKLSDLFEISMDQLVREGERPTPPEPQVIYVEGRKRESLTTTQNIGVIAEVVGAALAILGIADLPILLLAGIALVILGLPLLLAKHHPWIWLGWVIVTISLLFLNPYTSVAPWGLVGGVRYLYMLFTVPEMRYMTFYVAAATGLVRGGMVLLLIWQGWRAWKKKTTGRERK